MTRDVHVKRLILLLLIGFSACQLGEVPPTPPAADAIPGVTTHPARTMVPRSEKVSPSPTLAPYEQYTVDFLRGRTYGGGTIEVIETMEATDSFTRYLIRYPSDGLNIYGFVNVPQGEGPFPVLVMIHGFVDPATYETLDYTTPAADRLTQAGYMVMHPNLRGHPPSDNGDNLFRVGMAADVLNLIALVKSEAGPPQLFAKADSQNIGLWGHSLGGNIALRVLTIVPDIKAAVLYAAMSGDERKNAEWFFNASSDPLVQTELEVPPDIVEHISPAYYYSDIASPIQLHHGTADWTIPITWAEETCNRLTAAGVQMECIYYPEEDHTFRSRIADQFYGNMIVFYNQYLSP